jgi:hypothetical protein
MLTCPNSKNALRHVEYSESETLMAVLQDQVPGGAETLEVVAISIVLSSVQVPPPVPHRLITMGCAFFSQMSRFPIGLFKICFLGLFKF